MELSLSDLTVLVELTQKELNELTHVVENTDDEQLAEDCAIYLVQVGNTAGKLKSLYENLWTPDSNYGTYDDLIDSTNQSQ